jgi:hypothetical protein
MTAHTKKLSEKLKRRVRDEVISDVKRQMALDRFQEERPQLWLQSQRVTKLVEVQSQLEDETFLEGSCFLHANTVGFSTFCVKKVIGIDLDVCQVTIEIYGDEHLEGGVVVLPLETIEWFGFPARAVPTGIHFQGFTGHLGNSDERSEEHKKEADAHAAKPSEPAAKPPGKGSRSRA